MDDACLGHFEEQCWRAGVVLELEMMDVVVDGTSWAAGRGVRGMAC